MTTETCPHCGAKKSLKDTDFIQYQCGTIWWVSDGKTNGISDLCCARLLAQKDAEIERLKQAVLGERNACAEEAEKHASMGRGGYQIARAIRARGEVK